MEKLILNLPTISFDMLFTRELLLFIGVILALVLGVITALLGFRCLKTMLFLLMGALGGAVGYTVADRLTEQPEIHLIFFVIFCVVAWVLLAALSGFIAYLSKRARVYNFINAVTPYFTALLGAGIVFFIGWRYVYDDPAVVGGISLGLLAVGCLIGGLRWRKKRGFYTYEDLIRRPAAEETADA